MLVGGRPLALVVTPRVLGAANAAASVCDIVVWDDVDEQQDFLATRAAEVRAIVTVSTLPFPGKLADYASLELLAFYGAGYSMPETRTCMERGIAVSTGPGTNSLDVADLAIGLMITTVRRIGEGDRLVRSGGWRGLLPIAISPSLRGLRYGIVGFGAIGSAIADRLAPFGGSISWWGPNAKPDARYPRADSLVDLAKNSDVLIVAARGDDSASRLINAEIIAALGPGGYIINVSRGFVVDEDALIAALHDGKLAGAGLDVFDGEPTDPQKWVGLENIVLSPHIGGWARASEAAAADLLAENLRRHFAGEPLLTLAPRPTDLPPTPTPNSLRIEQIGLTRE
jgi:phosphoglycerate dehydrogenase-like enzyme